MEIPIKMDDLGVPPFTETAIWLVTKNSVTPTQKSSIFGSFFHDFHNFHHPFSGTVPLFLETPIWLSSPPLFPWQGINMEQFSRIALLFLKSFVNGESWSTANRQSIHLYHRASKLCKAKRMHPCLRQLVMKTPIFSRWMCLYNQGYAHSTRASKRQKWPQILWKMETMINWLVISIHLKNISQNGNLPQLGVKILKHVWSQHLVNHQLIQINIRISG